MTRFTGNWVSQGHMARFASDKVSLRNVEQQGLLLTRSASTVQRGLLLVTRSTRAKDAAQLAEAIGSACSEVLRSDLALRSV